MRFRRGLALVLAVLVTACSTVPPPSSPPPATVSSRPLDNQGLLAFFDKRDAAELSTSDLNLYSSLLLATSRFSDAEKVLLLVQTRTPADRDVLWTLTLLADARGDVPAMETRLSAFEKAWPDDAAGLDARARLLLDKGDRAGAQTAWTKALAAGENVDALLGLAQLALDARKNAQALAFAQRAVAAGPRDDRTWALRAAVHTAMKAHVPAKEDLDQAIALAPADPWHYLDRGKLLFLSFHALEPARSDLEFVTLKDPKNFFGWEALAEIYEELEQPVQARDAWLKALALRPDYRFGYPSAAMLSFRYQDWNRAAAFAREAAKDYPGEYAFPFVEALSLLALGQKDASKLVLERARPRFERGSTVDEMFRFLLTPGSEYYLNAALSKEPKDTVRLRLRFYQGCYYALTKSPLSAKAAFEEVEGSTLNKIPEIKAAHDWLEHGL